MKTDKKKNNLVIALMIVICLISIIVMLWALTRQEKNKQLEFTPPPFESTAVTGTPEVPAELGWKELDAQEFKVSVCGIVKIIDSKADIWFTNPACNTVWMKLRAIDNSGNILGETGLIKPDEYIQSIHFGTVPDEGEEIILKLMAYEPETYYSAGSATLKTMVAGNETE